MPSAREPKRLRVPEGIPGLLRDLIHERTGLFFEDSRMDVLLEKLEPCAQNIGCQSFLEYYYILKDNKQGEWDQAWESLSVQETYFYREISQINALTKVLVPEWFENHATTFRIWSAACATGEEPYTIAMALVEAGFGSHPIEIVGTDASSNALEKAGMAIYREKSFRVIPPALREKYFASVSGGWKLSSEITN